MLHLCHTAWGCDKLTMPITERAVWMRIYRNQLPHRRWGRRVLIPVRELERFLNNLPGVDAEEARERIGDGR